ncbi:uncharacterized protein [Anoplolepis gracilipes]|uniref:uncharacterized protein n=1 Tax=Anoplolepis gracilipes TaxID=354296 RepID=UPI003BA25789
MYTCEENHEKPPTWLIISVEDTLPHAADLHKVGSILRLQKVTTTLQYSPTTITDGGKWRMTMTKMSCCFHRLFTLIRSCILVRTCDWASRECTCRPYGHA